MTIDGSRCMSKRNWYFYLFEITNYILPEIIIFVFRKGDYVTRLMKSRYVMPKNVPGVDHVKVGWAG